MTLEAINSHVEEAMCKLLKSLFAAIIITPDMMERVSYGLCLVKNKCIFIFIVALFTTY